MKIFDTCTARAGAALTMLVAMGSLCGCIVAPPDRHDEHHDGYRDDNYRDSHHDTPRHHDDHRYHEERCSERDRDGACRDRDH